MKEKSNQQLQGIIKNARRGGVDSELEVDARTEWKRRFPEPPRSVRAFVDAQTLLSTRYATQEAIGGLLIEFPTIERRVTEDGQDLFIDIETDCYIDMYYIMANVNGMSMSIAKEIMLCLRATLERENS